MQILLFDVDGTLCESGKNISENISEILNDLIKKNIQIGIVGGGTYEKILTQLNGLIKPHYIFSECGSVYHKLNLEFNNYVLINKNNIRLEPEYLKINILIKYCLKYISEVDYLISGNFIDLRNGLIYVSLVGMVSTDEERANFIELDKKHNYRTNLIKTLQEIAFNLNMENYIDICLGGSVGIGIYPKKWNKNQVLNWLDGTTDEIHFFGDKYLPNGNDYALISNELIIPHPVDSPEQTFEQLKLFNADI
jgi:HAD superfamily hydrolase (TIGR01484 family)